jgi:L-asparagine transporter-like permease
MVSASNVSKIWFARAYGEDEYHELLLRLARKSKLFHMLAAPLVSAVFIAIIGFVLLLLCPDPSRDWGYWFAYGFLAYAFVIGFYGSLFFVRLFRKSRQIEEPKNPLP